MLPLMIAPVGQELTIIKIVGSPDRAKHLHTLGFTSGQKVEVLQQDGKAVVVKILESRLALDRSTASSIFVE